MRELQEETVLTALNLEFKGISGLTNPDKFERYVYYDFLCTNFEGHLLEDSRKGKPKCWQITNLDNISIQKDIRGRLSLYCCKGSFERIHY